MEKADSRDDDRARRHQELRRKFQEKLALRLLRRRNRKPVDPPPRYDDVFWEGQEWLDTL